MDVIGEVGVMVWRMQTRSRALEGTIRRAWDSCKDCLAYAEAGSDRRGKAYSHVGSGFVSCGRSLIVRLTIRRVSA